MARPQLRPQGIEARIERAIASLYRWLEGNRITRVPWAVIQTFSYAEGALLSGSMAYYTFLSLLPLLMVTGFVLGTISQGSAEIRDALSGAIAQLFPGVQASEILSQLIRARVAFGILGFIAVVYGGSGFVGALTACLNRMWRVPTGRSPVGQKLVNLLVIVLLGFVLLGSVGVTIWFSYLTRTLLHESATPVLRLIELVGSPLSVFAVLLTLYRILPARPLSWRTQVPGAILGAVGIEILKRAFTFWAQHSAGIAALPRSLLSVVLLLVWHGFFGQLILYGAAFNVVRERRRLGLPIMPPQQA